MNREKFEHQVTNYRVEGELVTTVQESLVIEAAVGVSIPLITAIASIRNGGDPIPDAWFRRKFCRETGSVFAVDTVIQ